MTEPEQASAADLIAQAQAAQTNEELDAIDAQAAGRVTVEQAVDARREELASQQTQATGGPAMSESSAAVVDPSPHAPPIMLNAQTLEEVLAAHQAPASDDEVLALEPNDYESATTGPDEQIDPNSYVSMTKPDGTTFLSPLSNVEHYEAKGYTAGATEEIPDLVAYHAERAAQEP